MKMIIIAVASSNGLTGTGEIYLIHRERLEEHNEDSYILIFPPDRFLAIARAISIGHQGTSTEENSLGSDWKLILSSFLWCFCQKTVANVLNIVYLLRITHIYLSRKTNAVSLSAAEELLLILI